jgi:hypothetical protein
MPPEGSKETWPKREEEAGASFGRGHEGEAEEEEEEERGTRC